MPVAVILHWTSGHLNLKIRNAPTPQPSHARRVGTGHGLIGLRERSRAAGGRLEAGPTDDSGYRVTAELRTKPDRPTEKPRP
ncbi:hypothetical protein BCD48_22035 [Pseudofrankia sp. BMG5.36]|nr:hypothetical protein BCD48_22035 [Pseudofrankia sp. BMG5.36]